MLRPTRVIDDDGRTVATAHKAKHARVIAAAPEAIAVLIEALPYVESELDNDAYKPGAVARMVERMKAVILKAEEESENAQ